MTFSKKLPEKNIPIATVLAFMLVPLSGIATDIYIPSLPKMVADLHTTESHIRLSITLFLISYGLSQFVSGALVDAFGRYRLSLVTLFIFSLSNIAIFETESVNIILAARVVQGICAGTIAAAKRTVIVDVYEGEKLKHYLSIMSIVWSIGPIVAPFIGGYLDHIFGWKSCFAFLGGYAFLVLILELIFSGETIRFYHEFKTKTLLAKYGEMLRDRDFFYGIFVLGLCYGMVILFGLVSPFIIEHKMGFTAVTAGYISLIMGFAWMCGGFIGKALIRRSFFPKIKSANFIQLFFAAMMIFSASFFSNIFSLVFFAFLIHVCAGFIFNNYFAFCLGRFPQMAGLSGGLAGGLNYIFCSLFSYGIVWAVNPGTQQSLGLAYLVLSVLMIAILLFISAEQKNRS